MMNSFGFNPSFGILGIFFIIAFLLVISFMTVHIVKVIKQWNKNNLAPQITTFATIVSKREEASQYHEGNSGDPSGAHGFRLVSFSEYFVTFQTDSGERKELQVPNEVYVNLVKGDYGKLTYQGTRYLEFELVPQ